MKYEIFDPLTDGISRLTLVNKMEDCSDLVPVNRARQSFGKESDAYKPKDAKLVDYLGGHGHAAPFRHLYFTWHVKAPISLARQWYKHVVGGGFVDLPWSELSTRYQSKLDFYVPKVFRAQSKDNKQASEGEISDAVEGEEAHEYALGEAKATYQELIDLGTAREVARDILPLATYTEWQWTASLQALAHFCDLRCDDHAQWEIRQYAEIIDKEMAKLVPDSWATLRENGGNAMRRKIKELEVALVAEKAAHDWTWKQSQYYGNERSVCSKCGSKELDL